MIDPLHSFMAPLARPEWNSGKSVGFVPLLVHFTSPIASSAVGDNTVTSVASELQVLA